MAECPAGRFGKGCTQNCSKGCMGGECDADDGNCIKGCKYPGFTGSQCDESQYFGSFLLLGETELTDSTVNAHVAGDACSELVTPLTVTAPLGVFLVEGETTASYGVRMALTARTAARGAASVTTEAVTPSRVTAHVDVYRGGLGPGVIRVIYSDTIDLLSALSKMATGTAAHPRTARTVRLEGAEPRQETVQKAVCPGGGIHFVIFPAHKTTTDRTVHTSANGARADVAFGPDTAEENCSSENTPKECDATCSHCHGGVLRCDVNGTCSDGCMLGWVGEDCSTPCAKGTFGANCSVQCGDCEGGDENCDAEYGFCKLGCHQPTVLPPFCLLPSQSACPVGIYGLNCDRSCGKCAGGPVNCHPVTGHCAFGCLDFFFGERDGENVRTEKDFLQNLNPFTGISSGRGGSGRDDLLTDFTNVDGTRRPSSSVQSLPPWRLPSTEMLSFSKYSRIVTKYGRIVTIK
ncbi:hypothetical protein BaRGS_00029351 [Batillaria attramentaria]|uniref:Uncharacterized protein n=1 Tax=Batillaria attramentaria TaxID=370345 RepID=A0ABD0JWF9_9CAEN